MVAPASPRNLANQSMDAVYAASDGVGLVKLAIGRKTAGSLTPDAAWQGVASHAQADAFGATDGLVVGGSVDINDGETVRAGRADSLGRQIVVVAPSVGVLTDGSGSIAAGGTAQTVFASNSTRKYLLIQNLHATEDLWVNFGTTAVTDQPSIKITAGAALLMDGSGFTSTQSVSAIAATTAHKFTAKQG